ncbi:L,D-transpeptidase family protein [Penaeicola halotolerans]|uniref:L,D-transpeptidase family protein n=1 Tax=Penaeicola halotolerans TaxID=2793196 RepID=UPI001CF8D3C7|nr:L,D-transpeptidase family protein [Penaeicola halotolerans]
MKRIKPSILLFILIILTLGFSRCTNKPDKQAVSDQLSLKIASIATDSTLTVGEPILQLDLIDQLYQKGNGLLSQKWDAENNVRELLSAIENATQNGLNPEDYHLTSINYLIEKIANSNPTSAEDVAELELLLTDSFLLLASHLAAGKTNATKIDPQWNAAKRDLEINWPTFVDSVLQAEKIAETLESLVPHHFQYTNLQKALLKYRSIQADGGWAAFNPTEPKLVKGMSHPDVILLRNRLAKTQGFISIDTSDSTLFDESLHQQLLIFQRRNGLTPDGTLGPKTVEALNITVDQRIETIAANLERWRWIDDSLGAKHIMVNIADFNMQLIENRKVVFETEAIVGRTYRRTPVFSSMMTFMVLNPDWTVPPTILNNDIIPAVRKNIRYLAQKNMKVITREGKEVDPSKIDWQKASSGNFPYMIRQMPGKDNALGQVKFMFPNSHNVYIHDTPTRDLFNQTERTFSSGCIRINRPIEFAKILVETHPSVAAEDIDRLLKQPNPKTIRFTQAIPVHLIYLTSWADDEGTVYFRPDIYDRDAILVAALKQAYERPNLAAN